MWAEPVNQLYTARKLTSPTARRQTLFCGYDSSSSRCRHNSATSLATSGLNSSWDYNIKQQGDKQVGSKKTIITTSSCNTAETHRDMSSRKTNVPKSTSTSNLLSPHDAPHAQWMVVVFGKFVICMIMDEVEVWRWKLQQAKLMMLTSSSPSSSF